VFGSRQSFQLPPAWALQQQPAPLQARGSSCPAAGCARSVAVSTRSEMQSRARMGRPSILGDHLKKRPLMITSKPASRRFVDYLSGSFARKDTASAEDECSALILARRPFESTSSEPLPFEKASLERGDRS
jgi:hypothetical protein